MYFFLFFIYNEMGRENDWAINVKRDGDDDKNNDTNDADIGGNSMMKKSQ